MLPSSTPARKAYRTGAFGGGELLAVQRRLASTCEPGEVVALIGESGSGKSTIGKMILRLAAARRAGAITFDGVDISTLAGPALKEYYARRAGRLPGPVQLVQPDLQGRPRLRDAPQRSTSRRRRAAEWQAKLDAVARGREPQPRRRARQVPAPAAAAGSSSAC